MTKRKIYFRADANVSIGYGHFIRTLALADMLKDNFECTFFTTSPSAYQIEEMKNVCAYVSLQEESKFDDFLNLLKGDEIVVLDNYFYTTEYMLLIRDLGCKLVYIDDLHNQHNVADVIIHHGFIESSKFDCEAYTKKCIGTEWALLRSPFLCTGNECNLRDGSVVVCMGGSDHMHLSSKIVSMLLELKIKKIKVIVGDVTILADDLKNKVEVLTKLSAKEMSEVLRQSSIAILCASTVCIEALYCGINIVCGYYVENQKESFEYLVSNDLAKSIGYLPELSKEDLNMAINFTDTKSVLPQFNGDNVKFKYISLFESL